MKPCPLCSRPPTLTGKEDEIVDLFAEIATELAELESQPLTMPVSRLRGVLRDLETVVGTVDVPEIKLQATRLAACAVRLLLSLPGGEL